MATGKTGKTEDGTPVPVDELSYSDAGAELDRIIEEFETGVVDVDRLVDQLERATEIVDDLDRRLRHTRMRVDELVPHLEAIGRGGSEDDDVAADDDGEPAEDADSDALF